MPPKRGESDINVKKLYGANSTGSVLDPITCLLPAAARNDDDAASTPPVNSSSPYTRAPANNPASGEPHSPTSTSPCPFHTKLDVDEGNESPLFRQGNV